MTVRIACILKAKLSNNQFEINAYTGFFLQNIRNLYICSIAKTLQPCTNQTAFSSSRVICQL